ncbi:beta strand repeat-containing protein [Spirosoma validum]|uniref:Ig-like domain-containing protein n=1 Tax=Spirosoma validum TaxID=2771355 RepID=A0A927B8I2_9BACT|nr:choice-of-anchor Q domain-containing protein [Spirosoma validum]MBD2757142.1 hypothetical protein [Spirosoma validum]
MRTQLFPIRLLLGVLFGLIMFGAQAQPIRYVKPTASGLGDGSSWANASADLQAMINASTSGNQVWVAAGTYTPNTTGLSDPRNAAFSLKNNVSVLGGFTGVSGSEGNINARTASPSSTTLSGDIGTLDSPSDNCYHVFYHNNNGLNNTAILDGVVIAMGNANGTSSGYDVRGGGMFNFGSGPTVNQCQFVGNSASGGGGIYCQTAGEKTKLTACSFVSNVGTQGGAILTYDTQTLINCYFSQNSASSLGGAIASASNLPLINCTFRDNRSPNGAVLAGTAGVATLTNCILWNNGSPFINLGGYTINASYCLISPGVTGYTNNGNNLSPTQSPFDNATGPELLPCAPAVDAGDETANATTTDVLGNTRKVRTIDMGAAEFAGTPYTVSVTALATPNTVCVGSPSSLQATASGSLNGPYTYTWTAPAGASLSSTNLNPTSATATTAGVASFSILVSDAVGCRATGSVNVTVNALPTATLTNNGPLSCAQPSVTLTASGGTSYTFTNGSGTVLGTSGATTTRSVTTAGTYSVRVANANGCVSTTSTTVISNTTTPTANILTPVSATLTCTTTALSLTATGGGTYRWENATTSAVRSVTTAGTYSVTVTSPNGCTATDSQVINVNSTLAATLGASSSTALVGSTISLSATGGSAYLWTAPAGASLSSPATSSAVSVSLTTPGLKTFAVVVTQGSCSQSLTVGVNAIQPPDLTVLLYARPTLVYGTAPFGVVVDVVETNGVASSGPITVKITKDAKMSLSLNGALTSVEGRSVQNGLWSLGSDASYYILTTSQSISGGNKLSVGLTGQLAAGSTTGMINCSATVVGGGESRTTNNIDADKIEYFQQ